MPSRTRRRSLWSILMALTLVALLTACGGSSSSGGTNSGTGASVTGPKNALVRCPSNTNTTAASPETGQIHLVVAGWSSTPAEDALVKQGLQNFEKLHPNVSVTWTPIPGDYATKMRANVASGNVPDVFYLQPPMAQEYIPAGKLLNLSPYMARDHVSPSTYYPSLMQDFDCADGTIFGIPKDWNSLGLFYNKTLFQQAGLGDPSNWTWDDLKNAAQKLTKRGSSPANSVYGIALPADASRWGAFLFANGGQMVSADGKQAVFNSQAGIQAAEFYTSFEQNHTGVMPGDVGASWDGDAFGKQQVAMTLEGGWMIPFLAQNYPKVQYGIAPLPIGPSGKRGNLLYTNAWAAYSGTKYPDMAWELIKYMTGAEYQTQVLHDGFALPTLTSLANDSYFQQNPGVKVLQDGAAYGQPDFYGVADTEIHNDVSNALQSIMLGKQSAADALNASAQKVNTWIQQNVAP
ncbi:ABC transporter substrate-binding protein [Thermogemmatispora onikobensis]|uniref:ABC transporter substrate-binding protein n=1 Tax=Thermogemmatispora onikobensis TaxID=732234 RepID=UPI0009FFDA0F|nr:sugar ABC transporter substrate-binding protein [Thermogemmatispora onikobensis]